MGSYRIIFLVDDRWILRFFKKWAITTLAKTRISKRVGG